jgi:hypothetical protein
MARESDPFRRDYQRVDRKLGRSIAGNLMGRSDATIARSFLAQLTHIAAAVEMTFGREISGLMICF